MLKVAAAEISKTESEVQMAIEADWLLPVACKPTDLVVEFSGITAQGGGDLGGRFDELRSGLRGLSRNVRMSIWEKTMAEELFQDE